TNRTCRVESNVEHITGERRELFLFVLLVLVVVVVIVVTSIVAVRGRLGFGGWQWEGVRIEVLGGRSQAAVDLGVEVVFDEQVRHDAHSEEREAEGRRIGGGEKQPGALKHRAPGWRSQRRALSE